MKQNRLCYRIGGLSQRIGASHGGSDNETGPDELVAGIVARSGGQRVATLDLGVCLALKEDCVLLP